MNNEQKGFGNNNDFQGIVKPKFGTGKLVLLVVLMLLIIGCLGLGVYYFMRINKPVSIYHNLIDEVVDEYISTQKELTESKNKLEFSADLNLLLKDGILDKEIVDFINKTSIKMVEEIDIKNNKFNVGLDADYDNASLLELKVFLDNDKMYIRFPEYYDKYIKVENSSDNTDGNINLVGEMSIYYLVNEEKAEEILKQELKSIIKENECQKEKDNYIFTLSEKSLLKRIKLVLINLKENQEFLNCFNNAELVKEYFEKEISDFDDSDVSEELITFKVNKKKFSNKVNEIKISDTTNEIIYLVKDKRIKFNLTQDGAKYEGYLKMSKTSNQHDKIEIYLNSSELGKIIINLECNLEKIDNVEEVEQSKVTTADAITETEMMEIMQKFQKSKLYSLVGGLLESSLGNSDSGTDVTNNVTIQGNPM